MPIQLDGVQYFTVTEVALAVGVTRQTFWRWRKQGHVPMGRQYRGREILYTSADLEFVRRYATHVEPIDSGNREQLRLFNGTL
jgi:predicted DNA-binding transcriptional regulator AlpA